jgi:hypothetical protein
MDGYVSKPIQIDTLSAEIANIMKRTSPSPTTAVQSVPLPLNRGLLVKLMDGDLELLEISVGIFRVEFPKILAEIRASVAAGNAGQLENAAHAMKGMLRGLAGDGPGALAQRLEQMGAALAMKDSVSVLTGLEAEIIHFDQELTYVLDDARAANSLATI